MDIPPGNTLVDPYGGAAQAAFPLAWPASPYPRRPGMAGSPDKTAAAAADIAAFVGSCRSTDFAVSGTAVVYSGPAEWSFRRMILHYASLAAAAGGVDAFLLSSELRGLTTARSGPSTYPCVDALVALAGDVKAILGSSTKVSYGADWSEWFGHHPTDGSGDVYFHLDPFWASGARRFHRHRQLHAARRLALRRPSRCRRRRNALGCRLPAPSGARRRGIRLVLCQRGRPVRAGAHADHRRRLCRTLDLALQGLGPAGGNRHTTIDRVASVAAGTTSWVAAIEADLADGDRLPGGGSRRQPAKHVPGRQLVCGRSSLFLARALATI